MHVLKKNLYISLASSAKQHGIKGKISSKNNGQLRLMLNG